MTINAKFYSKILNDPHYVTMLLECDSFFDSEIPINEENSVIVCKYGNDYMGYIVDEHSKALECCRENVIHYARIVTTHGEKISDSVGCINDYICTKSSYVRSCHHTKGEICRLDSSNLAMAEIFAKKNQDHLPEYNLGRLNNMIRHATDDVYGYIENGELIGYCVLQYAPKYNAVMIPEICIARDFRNRKYGKNLLSAITEQVLREYDYILYTGVEDVNVASAALAHSVGYTLLTSTHVVILK